MKVLGRRLKMGKDPAFLFYSKDFYSKTRTMIPEERACYVDLLIYQHQNNGLIPLDLNRVQMYCTGISLETLKQVLNQKFNHSADGWYNERLKQETEKRLSYRPKKIASACLAGLISSNKKLSKDTIHKVKHRFIISEFTHLEEKEIKIKVKEWFNETVNRMVNDLVNGNEDVNKDVTYPVLELKEKYKKENKVHEVLCKRESITKEKLFEMVDIFTDVLIAQNRKSDFWAEYTRYFNNWLPIELKKEVKKNKPRGILNN